jgi:hypothetical protein
MLPCSEVVRIVASDGLVDARRLSRLLVRVHLLYCRHCRGYARQLRLLGQEARRTAHAEREDPATLSRIERALLNRTGAEPPQTPSDRP